MGTPLRPELETTMSTSPALKSCLASISAVSPSCRSSSVSHAEHVEHAFLGHGVGDSLARLPDAVHLGALRFVEQSIKLEEHSAG